MAFVLNIESQAPGVARPLGAPVRTQATKRPATRPTTQATPRRIESLIGVCVTAVCAGYGCSYVITNTGELYTFGYGSSGQLGHGDDEDQHLPKVVSALRGEHVIEVAAGSRHGLCVLRSGKVFGWGDASDACLGLNLVADQLTPLAYEHRCAT